jgi:hypothetical protein
MRGRLPLLGCSFRFDFIGLSVLQQKNRRLGFAVPSACYKIRAFRSFFGVYRLIYVFLDHWVTFWAPFSAYKSGSAICAFPPILQRPCLYVVALPCPPLPALFPYTCLLALCQWLASFANLLFH